MTSYRSTIKLRSATKRRAKSYAWKGDRFSPTEAPLKGSIMDEKLQISSGSEFVLEEAEGSTGESVSLV